MASIEFPVPYVYPDQLLRETWVQWSRGSLNECHPPEFTRPRGFQDYLGAASSNARTRALEVYRLGFLRGLLVNRQAGSHNNVPFGWALIQQDQHVHTRLGYLAYAIGNALRVLATPTESLWGGLSCLCSISVVQMGISDSKNHMLTYSLFRYLRGAFPNPSILSESSWLRYLAAAMFCTLSRKQGSALIQDYISQAKTPRLWLYDSAGNSHELTVGNFLALTDQVSLSEITPPKPSLFWIGAPAETPMRGWYSLAAVRGERFLDAMSEVELSELASGKSNPFLELIRKPENQDPGCIIEQLDRILRPYPEAREEFETLMQTLYEGVIESLKYLTESHMPSQYRREFYVHPHMEFSGTGPVTIEVQRANCPGIPEPGEYVILGRRRFVVEDISESAGSVSITAVPG